LFVLRVGNLFSPLCPPYLPRVNRLSLVRLSRLPRFSILLQTRALAFPVYFGLNLNNGFKESIGVGLSVIPLVKQRVEVG
jgi:hypothetical protein